MNNRIVVDNQLINFDHVIQAFYEPQLSSVKLSVEFENARTLIFTGETATKIWHALRGEPELVIAQSDRTEEILEAVRHG